ncbi:MAG: aldo/keto reductase [Bacteroidota bacterium]
MSNLPLQIDSRVPLNDGFSMPLFGLGVYMSKEGNECQQAVSTAIEAGYRLIDTAAFYDNEESVGRAVRESQIPREELFVTTKLWNTDQGYDKALRAFDKSMDKLGLDYVDLYLIHYPLTGKRLDSWRALEQIVQSGRCRSIGVSNYLSRHLTELSEHSSIVPVVNQIEMSPYCFESRIETVEYCRQHGIVVQAYSPLVRTKVFDDPGLLEITNRHGKSPAQVLIRWGLQEGISSIPKSSNPDRIRANADVFDFELSVEDMQKLRSFDRNLIVCWDPAEAV